MQDVGPVGRDVSAHPFQPLRKQFQPRKTPRTGQVPRHVVPRLARTQARPRSSGVSCWRVDDLDAVVERDALDNPATGLRPSAVQSLEDDDLSISPWQQRLCGIDAACSAMTNCKKLKISRLCHQGMALAVQPTLNINCCHNRREHHKLSGVLRQRPLGVHDAVSDGGEHALDWVGWAQVIPVLGQASHSPRIMEAFVHGCVRPCPAGGVPR